MWRRIRLRSLMNLLTSQDLDHTVGTGPMRSRGNAGRGSVQRASADHCVGTDLLEGRSDGVGVFKRGGIATNWTAFSEIAPGVDRRRFLKGSSPTRREGGREVNPAIFPYTFQPGVEISPMPSAQGCRRALGQCPPRGRRKGTPRHQANDPGKSDAERSILDACGNQHSCQLVNRALPRAGRETPAGDLALRQPLAGAVRTTSFLERTAIDCEGICHGKSVFKGPETRGSDFSGALPVLRGSKGA